MRFSFQDSTISFAQPFVENVDDNYLTLEEITHLKDFKTTNNFHVSSDGNQLRFYLGKIF